MLRMLRFIILAAIVLAVAWLIAGLHGHFALAFGAYTLTTSLPVAILLLILLVAVLMLILGALGLLLRTPSRLSNRRVRIRRDKSEAASLRALSSIAAGDVSGADLHARAARRLAGEAPLALYVSGETARLAGRHDEADQYFTSLAKHPHAGFLGWRGLVSHNAAIGAPAQLQAQKATQNAALAYPGSSWLRGQRVRLAAREGDYATAARLTSEPRARAALAIMASRTATDQRLAIDWAGEAVKLAPDLAPAAIALAEARRGAGRERAARKTLLRAWGRAPHPALAEAYLAPITAPLERAKAAQALAAANPGHPESALLLARTALAANLPGEAIRHTEAAAQAGLDAGRLARLRADLAASEAGGPAPGDPAQLPALMQAALTAPPGPVWRCRACGTAHESWQATCRQCEAIGSLDWAIPASTTPAEPEDAPKLLANPAAVS
jgi:HemY protein